LSLNLVNPFMKFASGGGGAASALNWEKLGDDIASHGDDTMEVSVSDYQYYLLLGHCMKNGAINAKLRFNDDSSSHYAYTSYANGGVKFESAPDSRIDLYRDTDDKFFMAYIDNTQQDVKQVISKDMENTDTGSGDTPVRDQTVGKYVPSSNTSITKINVFNDNAGSFTTGSEILVLGADENVTASSAWELLGEQDVGGGGANIDIDIDPKKYLWIQAYNVDNGTGDVNMLFNDSTSGYAERYSDNFGSDATNGNMGGISSNYGALAGNTWHNYFVENFDGYQKQVMYTYGIDAGASGTAPDTLNAVGKWTGTSQISNVKISVGGGNFGDGSFCRIWGCE